jgi:hypothetical protein
MLIITILARTSTTPAYCLISYCDNRADLWNALPGGMAGIGPFDCFFHEFEVMFLHGLFLGS